MCNTAVKRDENDPTIIYFKFDHKVRKNEKIELSFNIERKFIELIDEYGYIKQYNAYSLGYSLPILAVYEKGEFVCHPFVKFGECNYADISNYSINITLPDGYDVAGSGNKTKQKN